ncbi:DUF3997 domain-containing protein [Puteibacter caeruleilacunae]|nr:DUF3997 domain-containing protein [Puteibacter caeruleilacunae]
MSKNKFNLSVILLVSMIFTSCIGSVVYERKLTAGYELSANDHISGMSIYTTDEQYQIGIVNATVFAVGYNKNFIIVKQHPFEGNSVNKAITNYFIIPIKNDGNLPPDKNKIGPLTYHDFLKKRNELGISNDLNFTITIDELQ